MMSSSIFPRDPQVSVSPHCYSRYHSDAAAAQYCDAHYGPDKFGVPNFPAQLARLCTDAAATDRRGRALDLGCAVGRASFELAKHFEQVRGIDYSARFIDLARRLRERGTLTYQVFEEGELVADRRVCLADLDLAAGAARVGFEQGDALQLDAQTDGYDLVLAANLLDRLSDPGAFLAGVHRLVAEGGLLAIASPYNWMEEFTPRKNWLGGFFRYGAAVTSAEQLHKRLAGHFVPVGSPRDLELVIRENARKYQHYVSELTLWRRVDPQR
ncbi:putative 4-mercaptohistidine N1-methyltransferase [Geoalkalibacter halelectricus]|uniref:4-mercaptohistidine N1-methyltransferase n=1 Tax=Geoalkalibacter halelectricus TaxID=2847045 RepID=A0ABY5ZNE9_9BACT|nr:putative 4-mercaptohistidine N1-methyltransferase [Geoalkalibacter halelectricus]MDO3377570.1 putative 4-mercaptohistidine N1-methyltransferase [Geoalkalibacter halelectricus]UWZ80672.1 putative 4-mercaptohistidine N1-methyltransferase [Geoalkalibacter halelectricus]